MPMFDKGGNSVSHITRKGIVLWAESSIKQSEQKLKLHQVDHLPCHDKWWFKAYSSNRALTDQLVVNN